MDIQDMIDKVNLCILCKKSVYGIRSESKERNFVLNWSLNLSFQLYFLAL